MISGACHCGAINFTLNQTPEWLTACNCSYCRRAGWLLAHAPADQVTLSYSPDQIIQYQHGDHTLAFVSCKICGCTTHWESTAPENQPRMAVNCLMADPDAIKNIPVRRFDGNDSWTWLD